MKKRKKIGISVLLSATLLVAIVFVPIASAQGNPVNSGDLASHYQNTTGAPYSSSASWNTQIGTVNANAEFYHPILSDRNAWSQVQVDKDGNVYQDGAIY